MKIAVIFLDYFRHEHTKQALRSISNAGHPYDLFTIQKKGIARAINDGLDKTKNYDAIVTCANDIEMPENWLAEMVSYAKTIPQSGMIGFHTVEGLPEVTRVNGLNIHKIFTAFGNVMIPRKAVDKIGYFNEEQDPYGMQDADYAFRLNKSGFINYYIPNLKANHIGNDVGQQTDYRRMKDEGLAKAGAIYNASCFKYDQTENYTIFQRQFL